MGSAACKHFGQPRGPVQQQEEQVPARGTTKALTTTRIEEDDYIQLTSGSGNSAPDDEDAGAVGAGGEDSDEDGDELDKAVRVFEKDPDDFANASDTEDDGEYDSDFDLEQYADANWVNVFDVDLDEDEKIEVFGQYSAPHLRMLLEEEPDFDGQKNQIEEYLQANGA